MKANPFRQKAPRCTATVRCQCFAKSVLFLSWESMPEEARVEFKENGPIPCEGGGVPGEWCGDCRFGKVRAPEIEE